MRAATAAATSTAFAIGACASTAQMPPKRVVVTVPKTVAPPTPATLVVRTASGEPAPWAVFEVYRAGTQEGQAFLRGDASGHVALTLPPGDYDAHVTAPNGFARKQLLRVREGSSVSVTLDETCKRTSGTAAGDIEPGEYVWFLGNMAEVGSTVRFYGAVVQPDATFAACVPVGSYAVEAHDDEVAPAFNFDSGDDVLFEAYEPARTDAPAPAIDSVPFARSIDALLEPSVRVIGLGEANHGSHSFLAIRARESLRLARLAGVRTIALEAGPAEVFPLDDYVQGRLPDATTAVSKLGYWMWDTKDMLAVLAEIRAYNKKARPDARVTLVGVDVQSSDRAATYVLASSVKLTDSQRTALEGAATWTSLASGSPDAAAFAREIDALVQSTEAEALPLRTMLALRQVQWRLRMHAARGRTAQKQRDLGMAAITEALLARRDQGRIVIWAHNNHIATDPLSEVQPLGSHLRKRLGDGYLAVGLLMARGTFRAWDYESKVGVIEHTISEPAAATIEAALAPHLATPDGFVRLDDLTALKTWLSVPHRASENGGAMVWKNRLVLIRPRASFDIVGLVANSTPTTPTPTGVRVAPTQ
ncbi:MAG TPA: erythromycin esterase family protein [Kofleriaceae bacterium]|nr:erythromycin esterase family protein [Kofleriaceae bacterium]